MSQLEILGAGGGNVTGSAFRLTTRSGGNIQIDCGLVQGEQDNGRHDRRYKSIPGLGLTKKLDAIVITHAHIDHSGMLPSLAYMEDTPIYMTPATFDLTQIALYDTQRISPWLFSKEDIKKVADRTIKVEYNTPFSVDGATCKFRDAGHILGSSALVIDEKGGDKIVFSGDLGNDSPTRLVEPTEMIEGADILVMESTYGDRNHTMDSPYEVLADAVEQAKCNDSTLLIPVFSIHKQQAATFALGQLCRDNKLLGIQTYLDGPMGMAVTDVYNKYLSLLNEQVRQRERPFDFKGLIKINSNEESRKIRRNKGAKIIIAGAGMMTGGRIVNHAQEHLSDRKSIIQFVGFATEGTPARKIMDGEEYVEVGEKQIYVRGTVRKTSSMSAHADQNQLLKWAKYATKGDRRTREIVLIHGNNKARDALEDRLLSEVGVHVMKPNIGDVIDFDQNDH